MPRKRFELRILFTQVQLVHSADDNEYTDGYFAHGEHVLDLQVELDAGVIDRRDGT